MSCFIEQIEWRESSVEMPDDEQSVLICAGGEVGEAFHEDGAWYWASGGGFQGEVMWCAMPEGRVGA